MRYSQLLATTRKELSTTYGIPSQDMLIQAGYIRPLAAGIFSTMHLAQRTFRKIERILREEMERVGGVEISMPVVHPAEIWKKTNRFFDIDESLVRFRDRSERDMVLAMTHEEVVASLAASDLNSYRQFPKLVYQVQTKFRDEARSRGGLIRVREFVMKDAYSLDISWEGLQKQYDAQFEAYERIFMRVGLPVMAIESDVGMMGGRMAHEFMYITDMGEDTIFICDNTGYRANREVAAMKKPMPEEEPLLPMEKVHTPGTKTIDDVSSFLGITTARCGKVVFYTGQLDKEDKVVMAIVRGDMEVNQNKLQALLKMKELVPATEEQIIGIGSVPGYATPVAVDRSKTILVVDDLVAVSPNLVLGANEEDHHVRNVCYGRDFTADFVADIVVALEGALAPDAKTEKDTLKAIRGIEVGNIFQLGTKYTDAMEAFYTDESGQRRSIIMGSYGIGVGRLLGCLAEEYHDDRGLSLPVQVAPYEVVIVALLDNEEVRETADRIYDHLSASGIEVLYDDRDKKSARAGEKFADADLIGIPVRLTISSRSLKNGGVEIKLRPEETGKIISTGDVAENVARLLQELHDSQKM